MLFFFLKYVKINNMISDFAKDTTIDLVLISPPSVGNKLTLGLLTIASYVRQHGFKVKIIDSSYQNYEQELKNIYASADILAVGVSAFTNTVLSAYEVCKFVKRELSPNIYCLIGGFHPTALPKECLQESEFDLAVVGEGEQATLEILEKLKQKQFPTYASGAVEKFNNDIIVNPPRELIADLDMLPLPAYDLIDMGRHYHAIRNDRGHLKKVPVLLVSRGCPFDCVFCGSKIMWQRKLRFFSIDYIVKELKFLIETYDIDGVSFLDDELVVNQKFITEFCEALIKNNLSKKIKWSCHARVDSVTPELIKKIKQAGCILVRFGIESGSEKCLAFLKQNTATVAKSKQAVQICNNEGLESFGSFIIGSPDETLDDILATIDFIENSNLSNVDVFVAVPYPGTALYQLVKEQNLLKENITWADFIIKGVGARPIIKNNNFTSDELHYIEKYIDNHVVIPLNRGLKLKKRNHGQELEKILKGDLRGLAMPKIYQFGLIRKKIIKAIKNPYLFLPFFRKYIWNRAKRFLLSPIKVARG